jgi:hypothetical protein
MLFESDFYNACSCKYLILHIVVIVVVIIVVSNNNIINLGEELAT